MVKSMNKDKIINSEEDFWSITVCILCNKDLTVDSEMDKSKLMECLHAVCHNCFSEWKDNEEKQCQHCSLSSAKQKLRDNKILSEIATSKKESDALELCVMHNLSVTHWCENCGEYVCRQCIEHHEQLKSTKEHIIVTADEKGIKINPKLVFPCKKHPNNQMTIMCTTCSFMTCRDCQLELHRDHTYEFVDDLAVNARKEIFSLLIRVEHQELFLRAAQEQLSSKADKLEGMKKTLIAEIKKAYDELIIMIEKRAGELMLDGLNKINNKLEACSMYKYDIEKVRASLDRSTSLINAILTKSSDPVIFYSKETLLNYMKKLNMGLRVPNAIDCPYLKFVPVEMNKLKHTLEKSGFLDESPDFPSDSETIVEEAADFVLSEYSKEEKEKMMDLLNYEVKMGRFLTQVKVHHKKHQEPQPIVKQEPPSESNEMQVQPSQSNQMQVEPFQEHGKLSQPNEDQEQAFQDNEPSRKRCGRQYSRGRGRGRGRRRGGRMWTEALGRRAKLPRRAQPARSSNDDDSSPLRPTQSQPQTQPPAVSYQALQPYISTYCSVSESHSGQKKLRSQKEEEMPQNPQAWDSEEGTSVPVKGEVKKMRVDTEPIVNLDGVQVVVKKEPDIPHSTTSRSGEEEALCEPAKPLLRVIEAASTSRLIGLGDVGRCAICLSGSYHIRCLKCSKFFHRRCHAPRTANREKSGSWNCIMCRELAPVNLLSPSVQQSTAITRPELLVASCLVMEYYCIISTYSINHEVTADSVVLLREQLQTIRNNLDNQAYKNIVQFVLDINSIVYELKVKDTAGVFISTLKNFEQVFNRLFDMSSSLILSNFLNSVPKQCLSL